MKRIFSDTILWDKYDEYDGTGDSLFLEIDKVLLSHDERSLRLKTRLNFVLRPDDHLRVCAFISNSLRKHFSDFQGVDIEYVYEDVVTEKTDIVRRIIPHFSEGILSFNGMDSSDFSFLKTLKDEDVILEDDGIYIDVLGRSTEERLNGKASDVLEKALKSFFGIDERIVFRNNEELYRELSSESDSYERSAFLEAKEAAKELASKMGSGKNHEKDKGYYSGSGGRKKVREEPVKGNLIMGRAISGERTPLSALSVELGSVVAEGILFRKNERSIKSGKKLVTLCITDRKTSVCIKAFVSEEKWNDIDTHLKCGDMVIVKGDVEWDTYDNLLVIMAKSIEKGEVQVRTDTAPEKRVELHLHTRMSAMDGFCDTAAVIKQAAKWGHKAIAITDHGVVQSFPDAVHTVYDGGMNEKVLDIKVIYGVEAYLYDDEGYIDEDGNIDYKAHGYNHAILLAENQTGLHNLYRLVSFSHIDYMYKKPRMPKSVISKYREGLILGSACEAGEVFRAITSGMSDEEIKKKAEFYDYLEIQPIINNSFMIASDRFPDVRNEDDLRDLNRRVVELGEELGMPVCATCDAHYMDEEDSIYREIILTGQGFKDVGGGLYFRTTDEMLSEFSYLGDEKAHEVVVDAPNMIAGRISEVFPIAKGKFPPKIDNADEILRTKCYERAKKMYGDPLPEPIDKRLTKELESIIGNGYAVMYVSAEMLVQKSLSDGFLVGSRGSVGSSFAATMAGITEVNPLAPHYICPECKTLIWGDESLYDCGVDMPEMMCPSCGRKMNQEGFAIPFETFLGFDGDKEPDIDLNFAGEYQATAHKFVDEIFGSKNVFKAGTIGTLADKTAYGFVMKYFDEKDIPVNRIDVERLKDGCVGVKRTTGQHPGGIIIVPEGHEIYEFCPVQRPANDTKTDIVTTHFDYHSIDQNLLKLDILGHDVPSMIRQLQDLTGEDPLTVPLKDEKVNSIFNGIEGLDIIEDDYAFTHGSYGVPEFGTKFVRQMLDDTKPSRFGDLVRISGFSHGTNVWLNNAQEFIRNGTATMKDAISTRDDIMNYLILKGVPNGKAFKIMEKVRKGKGVSEENVEIMKEHDVPDWYIESCQRISYMFPRAHAVAYVIMSYRIAYYKVHFPAAFYAVFFTTKISDFNWGVIRQGRDAILRRLEEIEAKGKNATKKEEVEVIPLELAYEMYSRGYEFMDPSLSDSLAVQFTLKDGKVVVPFCALDGVGESAGRAIEDEYRKKPFMTVEDMTDRAKVNKTAVESLRAYGVLGDLPESDQISFFGQI